MLANIKYEAPAVSILLENYSFYESTHNPFVALRYVGDNQTGSAVVGRVANHTYGAELGADVVKNVKATIAYDGSPTGLTALTAPRPFGAAVVGTRAAFGSIASPYSDGYATDPLFTTSLITGPVETRSSRSYKAGLYYTSDNKRLKFYATRAIFENVGFTPLNTQYETDGDVTYFLNPVGKGPYKGLSIRERYGVRNQPLVTGNHRSSTCARKSNTRSKNGSGLRPQIDGDRFQRTSPTVRIFRKHPNLRCLPGLPIVQSVSPCPQGITDRNFLRQTRRRARVYAIRNSAMNAPRTTDSHGPVAVVTGAATGLGRTIAIAIAFARSGMRVVVNYRDHEARR